MPDASARGDWWRQRIVYEIFPLTFMDATGDGIGDLPGITERLDYISSLGVAAIWMTPIHPSPLADFGYDVADYRGVDPRFGSRDPVLLLRRRTRDAPRGRRAGSPAGPPWL